jgi:hypothetical protein
MGRRILNSQEQRKKNKYNRSQVDMRFYFLKVLKFIQQKTQNQRGVRGDIGGDKVHSKGEQKSWKQTQNEPNSYCKN